MIAGVFAGEHRRRGLPSAFAFIGLLLAVLASPALARDAYVANYDDGTISVINTRTNQVVGSPITVGTKPNAIAITPDGRFAYVANFGSNSVSVIDTQTNQTVGSAITVGTKPQGIAISPDGRFAYVANSGSNSVSVIDTANNQTVGSPITVGPAPYAIAITPNGKRAYVANNGSTTVSVINTQTDQTVGSAITVGTNPIAIAITPDGKRAYVVNNDNNNVSVIDTGTNQTIGSQISVGTFPVAIAITPDGQTAYVANSGSTTVSVIDTATSQAGSAITVGTAPYAIAIKPNGRTAYVANAGSTNVSRINTETNQTAASAITVGNNPEGVAITPDQPPVAFFAYPFARPRVPVAFSASASSDPDGSVARYDWVFGDGHTAHDGDRSQSHTYAVPGKYHATLTLTDDEGCSTALIFTGQTAYCNGSAVANRTRTVKVVFPGVRIKCPKSAKPSGCKFKLHAVTKRRKGKAETGVARAELKAGESEVVSLEPKAAFAAKLASAKKILVKEAVTINGSKKTLVRRLRVVQ